MFIDAVYAAMIIFFCSNEPVLVLISVMCPFTDAVNVFIDEVYAEIITSLASCEDVNVFIDEVYAEIITSFASCEDVNVFIDDV